MRSTDTKRSTRLASATAGKANIMATLSAKEAAAKLDTTPKTLRKFMRSEVKANGGAVGIDTPGKGGRWAIEAKSIAPMKKRFAAWQKAQAEANAARLAAAAEEANSEEVEDDEVEATESD